MIAPGPRPLHLCILLHMHQPFYVDPATAGQEHGSFYQLLPWVRLHGAAGYLDVAEALARHPEVAMTINFVPSLLRQLEAVCNGARDRYLDMAERPADALDLEERVFLLSRFFSINWSRCVDTRPRYRELLDKRGRSVGPKELRQRAAQFSTQELRDLQVLFHLSWLGWAARQDDDAIAELERKGRDFTEEELRLVLERGLAACRRVLPLYRQLAARGQVELSCSPYYHPIVPLLCDTEVAHVAQPDLPLPARLSYPEDALEQIVRGRAAFSEVFGIPAGGMWPPEGSLSPAALHCYAQAGATWLVSDEGNLWRSLGQAPRHALYRAYRHEGVPLFFRDRDLSDRIGFRYAQQDAEAAVQDLLHGVAHGPDPSQLEAAEVPVVTLALDGENPWQAYPDHGRPFLLALCGHLARHPVIGPYRIEPQTFSGHLSMSTPRPLLRLHAGSWIDSDFHIWIGDPVKNRAWELLRRARQEYEEVAAQRPGDPGLQRARDLLLCAEGSDWFWWFGEPFHSSEDAIYDALFRGYLQAAYRALSRPVPGELLDPVDDRPGRPGGPEVQPPRALIHPCIDGRRSSYYEWIGAGCFEVPVGAAMADRPDLVAIHFGFDEEHLYLRVDPQSPALLREAAVALDLVAPEASGPLGRGLRLLVRPERPGRWQLYHAEGTGFANQEEDGPAGVGEILEVGAPLSLLGAAPGQQLQLVVRLLVGDQPFARYPRDGAILMAVPDPSFAAAQWS
ncbi:MAG: glycoside hydrolase family 57 protein [Myxococcales bacterium]|nr:glycoside hydrolase family 57 protein [Myxococcota bacterium]MDW8282829.1 glycoside hydrolase family 57 protein [Myxococcales bacterium]